MSMYFGQEQYIFHKKLFEKLKNKQVEVESLRKLYLKKQIFWTIYIGLLFAIYTILVVIYLLPTDFLKYFSIIGYFLIIAFSPTPPFKTYIKEYKKRVIPITAHACGYTYQKKGGCAWNASTPPRELFDQFVRSEHSDGFYGQYGEVTVAFENIHLFWENHNQAERTRFNGLFIALTGLTHTRTNVLLRSAENRLARKLTEQELSPMQRVLFDDTGFERQFDVYSTDEKETRRILTNKMIQELTEIKDFYNGAPIQVAFVEDKIFIAIEKAQVSFTHPSLFQPIKLTETAKELINSIQMLHQLVENLRT